MPEGRVRNTGSSLKAEYIITDHQGNARISFEDSGTGTAKVVQENSYYAFGMSMTSTMALPTVPNKNLYNGGAEWQNDFADQPDWQQTFYRNYDAALGRFLAVDPMAEASESMTVYQYAGNNPIMMNDPMGDLQMYGGRPQLAQNYSNGLYYDGYDLPQHMNMGDENGGNGFGGPYQGFWNNFKNTYTNNGSNFHFSGESVSDLNQSWINGKAGVTYYYDLNGNLEDILPNGGSTNMIRALRDNFDGFTHHQSYENVGDAYDAGNAIQEGDGIILGFIGTSLDEISKIKSSVGIYTQRFNFSYHANGWTGSQYVNTFKLGKGIGRLSDGLSVYTTGKAYYDIANGDDKVLTYFDAGVGTIGLGTKVISYFTGVQYPVIGEGVAIYGISRLGWDIGSIMAEGNRQYLESARSEGCYVCTLPH